MTNDEKEELVRIASLSAYTAIEEKFVGTRGAEHSQMYMATLASLLYNFARRVQKDGDGAIMFIANRAIEAYQEEKGKDGTDS